MKLSFEKCGVWEGHKGAIYTLSPSLSPGRVWAAGSDGILSEWEPDSGEGTSLCQESNPIFSILPMPALGLAALGMQDGTVTLYDHLSKRVIFRQKLDAGAIFDFAFFPESLQLWVATQKGKLFTLDLKMLSFSGSWALSPKSIRSLAVHPDGTCIAVASSDHRIRLINPELKELQSWEGHFLPVFRVLWSQEGGTLWSVGRDAHLREWRWDGKAQTGLSVAAHMGTINDVISIPEKKLLVTASMDKSIKIWDAQSLTLLKVADQVKNGVHSHGVNRILWVGNHLFSCGDDRTIMKWALISE